MTLSELLRNIDHYSTGTILVEKPWSAQSRALVRDFPIETPAAAMVDDGRCYFLEVFLAQELKDDLLRSGAHDDEAICNRIISYAINDA